jgi:hypothetical protein
MWNFDLLEKTLVSKIGNLSALYTTPICMHVCDENKCVVIALLGFNSPRWHVFHSCVDMRLQRKTCLKEGHQSNVMLCWNKRSSISSLNRWWMVVKCAHTDRHPPNTHPLKSYTHRCYENKNGVIDSLGFNTTWHVCHS